VENNFVKTPFGLNFPRGEMKFPGGILISSPGNGLEYTLMSAFHVNTFRILRVKLYFDDILYFYVCNSSCIVHKKYASLTQWFITREQYDWIESISRVI